MTIGPAGQISRLTSALGSRLDGTPLVMMLDVDGTLAPIAPVPTAARVPPETREVVARLVAQPGVTVALVSGRSAEDAWRLVAVEGVWAIGNHGYELRQPAGQITPDERALPYAATIQDAVQALEADLEAIPGVIVENKRWTISVHYRMADPGTVPAIVRRSSQEAERRGLRVLDGKKIVELRPPLEVHKGTACVTFAASVGIAPGKGSAFYAGDDRTDEDAFLALRAAWPQTVTVLVGPSPDLSSTSTHAEHSVPGLEELRELLVWVADRRGGEAPAR